MLSIAATRSRGSRRRTYVAAAFIATSFLGAGRTLLAQTSAATETRPGLTLAGLLDSVALRHPAVEAARARVRAARGARTTAGALGNPVLGYDVENAPLPGRDAPPMDREVMTTVTLPLEVLYQRGARVRRANADVRAVEADAAGARQRVALEAARAYYRTALAQVSLAAARDLSGWLDTLVVYNRTRVREGATAEADLLRSELERDRAAADASLDEAELIRARADLATFLGDVTLPLRGLAVALDDRPLALPALTDAAGPPIMTTTAPRSDPVSFGAAPDDALAQRPEVRAARERLASAGAGVGAERSMIFRQLGATVGTKQSAGTTSLVAGVSLPIPLFDQNRGEVARATAEREAAAFDLAAEERSARAELVGAYEAARLLTDRASALTAGAGPSSGYLARADEARRVALGAYREGAVPLLQVLDAARAWGEARVTFYRTLYAQHEGVIALLAARGTDLFTAVPALAARGPSTR